MRIQIRFLSTHPKDLCHLPTCMGLLAPYLGVHHDSTSWWLHALTLSSQTLDSCKIYECGRRVYSYLSKQVQTIFWSTQFKVSLKKTTIYATIHCSLHASCMITSPLCIRLSTDYVYILDHTIEFIDPLVNINGVGTHYFSNPNYLASKVNNG